MSKSHNTQISRYRMKVAGLSPQRPKFGLSLVHVGFLVNRLGLEQFFFPILWLSPVTHALYSCIHSPILYKLSN